MYCYWSLHGQQYLAANINMLCSAAQVCVCGKGDNQEARFINKLPVTCGLVRLFRLRLFGSPAALPARLYVDEMRRCAIPGADCVPMVMTRCRALVQSSHSSSDADDAIWRYRCTRYNIRANRSTRLHNMCIAHRSDLLSSSTTWFKL